MAAYADGDLASRRRHEELSMGPREEGAAVQPTHSIPPSRHCNMDQMFVHQGGPQMSVNGEKFIAINFPHLKNTLKLRKNTDLDNIDSTYSPQNMKHGSCTDSVQSPGDKQKYHNFFYLFVGLY